MRWLCLGVAVAIGGCSALIDPDSSRLGGGVDAGRDAGEDPCPGGCDDGIACTDDVCEATGCVSTPNPTRCGEDERCAASLGCVPLRCSSDAECSDGRPCNGEEVCDGSDPTTGCGPGDPLECDDGIDCTVDACANGAGGCVFEARDTACDDDVDCTTDRCILGEGCQNEVDDLFCDGACNMGGVCDPERGCVGSVARDCRDSNPCTSDSCDPASGCVNEPRDDDGDGFTISAIGGRMCGGDDCNDGDGAINPDATERCNGIDDDCDDRVDEEGCDTLPDTCDTAETLTLTGGSADVRGRFDGLRNDFSPPECNAPGPDAVYILTLPRGTFDVTIDTIGSEEDTVLAVSTACGDWDFAGRGCNDDIAGTELDSRIWVHRVGSLLSETRLFILVDSFSSTATDDYRLNVSIETARSDDCSRPLDISGGGSVIGFPPSLAGIGGQRGSCQSADAFIAGEGVFAFTNSGESNFRAWATGFRPALYARVRCNSADSELACQAGTTPEITVDDDGFVFVDGMMGMGNRYTLEFDP
ncbi:MAG: hypothetical protein AAGE52_31755 [Myxococcota bacterium]